MRVKLVLLLLAVGLLAPGFGWLTVRADHAQRDPPPAAGVATITGTIPAIPSAAYASVAPADAYVFLTDLSAFVARDHTMPLPSVSRRITTGVEGDLVEGAGFSLALPVAPPGATNDVGHGEGGTGVQIFAVSLASTAAGGRFTAAAEWVGWPRAYSSIVTAPGSHEVMGGAVAVWSADERQLFPTGFGADGMLFTPDDPIAEVQPGWTVVEMHLPRFTFTRDAVVDVTLDEGIGQDGPYRSGPMPRRSVR